MGKDNDIIIPNNLAISNEKIKSNGVYILDCSEYIFVYVCNDVSPATIREVNIFIINNLDFWCIKYEWYCKYRWNTLIGYRLKLDS